MLNHVPITWESRKQRTVALSSTEAAYVGSSEAIKENIYERAFLLDIGYDNFATIVLYNDNAAAYVILSEKLYY